MATVEDLKSALRESLEVRGVLAQLRARVRAEVFGVLDDEREHERRPSPPPVTFLITELIREFLRYHKYNYTESVLTSEAGQSDVPLDRQFIANELNITEEPSSQNLPLLYGLVSHFLNKDEGKR